RRGRRGVRAAVVGRLAHVGRHRGRLRRDRGGPPARLKIGDIELVPLSDGTAKVPTEWYVNIDWDAHPGLLADDGRFHIPIGCYLLRTGDRTILLDAGLGPHDSEFAHGGDLPAELARAGVAPDDVDDVICTHL